MVCFEKRVNWWDEGKVKEKKKEVECRNISWWNEISIVQCQS